MNILWQQAWLRHKGVKWLAWAARRDGCSVHLGSRDHYGFQLSAVNTGSSCLMNAAAVSLKHPPSFTQKAWLRTQLHIGSSQQFSLLSHKMWKTRPSTLIRQTLRAELCVIYPLLALWNKFLLLHWNLKEGTENSSSLGISGLDSSWTQSERIYTVHILMCMCNTHTPPSLFDEEHRAYFLANIDPVISSMIFWVKKLWSSSSFTWTLPISVRWRKGDIWVCHTSPGFILSISWCYIL